MAPSGSAPAVPVRLGRYEVRARLAGGAMGEVFEALDPTMGRRVVLKTIRPDLLEGERGDEMVARFQRECRLLGSVAHPNVVTMYDAGRDEGTGTLFMVMEHVDGVDLSSLLRGGMRFPVGQIRAIALDLARALQAAHAAGIIHRDVKPANILLTPAGQVKLTDFGIARREIDAITARGVHVGTPGYEAPEQARGDEVDDRGDLYALGMVLRELLTGRKPGEPDAATRSDLAETIPLGESPPQDDEELEALVTRLRSPDPEDRPRDATTVVRTLEGALASTAPAATGFSALPRLHPAAPRRPLVVPVVIGLVLLAVLAWGVFRIAAYGLQESDRILAPPGARPTPAPEEHRRPRPHAPRTPRGTATPERAGDAEQATPAPDREEQFRQMEREYRDWSRPDERKP